jgi:hypothetical protein
VSYGGYNFGYGGTAPAEVGNGQVVVAGEPTTFEGTGVAEVLIPPPPGTTAGDLLIAAVTHSSGTAIAGAGAPAGYVGGYAAGYVVGSVDPPAGWALAGHAESTKHAVAVFYRYATASEPSEYAFPVYATGRTAGMMQRFTGVDAVHALDTVVSSATTGAATSTAGLTLPQLTTGTNNTLLFSAYSINTLTNPAPVVPAGMTLLTKTTSMDGRSLATAYETRSAAGATGSRTWSMDPNVSGYHQVGVMLALRPAVGSVLSGVTSSRSTSWTTKARVTGTRTASWNTLSALASTRVTVSRSTSWQVASGISSVTAARSTTWVVRARLLVSRSASWSDFTITTDVVKPAIRLRAYAPNGADLGPLPTPEAVTAAYPLDDIGGLSLTYAAIAPRSNLLGQPCEIAVEVSPDNGRNWMEPDNSRFLYLTDGADPLEQAPKYAVEAKGYVFVFTKARVLPNGQINADGKRAFLSATPGAILKTLITEAQTRGALNGVTHSSFSAGADSAGAAWAKQLTIYYEPGLDLLAILQNLADQGFIDFRMRKRELLVYNADTAMAVDRTVGAGQVTLRAGRDLTEAPFRRTWEGLASYAYFAGDAGAKYEYTNPAAVTPWGRWETFISNGSVSDQGTMAALTQAELALANDVRTEYTRGLDFIRATSRPFWDYNVGDYVWSSVDGSGVTRLRIRQLTLTSNEKGIVQGNVVLNDRFLEADVRQKRRIDGITNGASGGTGTGTPSNPADNAKDILAPAKVGGLVASSTAYMGAGGFPQAQVTLSWTPVSTNSDGTPIDDLDHYEIYQRPYDADITARRQVASTTDTDFSLSPYQAGSNWFFAVRAVDNNGNRGIMSNETAVGMARDTIPPQAPSTPIVTARLGVVNVYWDGLPAVGSWPADFHHVEVHASTINNFTPTAATEQGHLYGQGSTIITDAAFGVPMYVRFIAVDTSDLKSDASSQASGMPSRLVGTDIDPNAITYEQIGFKDPGNLVPDGSFETVAYRDAVTAREASWSFTTADFYHADWAATIDAAVGAGTVRHLYLMGMTELQQILPTDKLFARFAYKATTAATGTLRLAVQWVLSTGLNSYSFITATTKNGTWQQIAGKVTAPAGTEYFRMFIELDAAATAGTYTVDAVEVRRTVGTSIIEDAAIKNAQIDLLAVNSAQIMNLDVGKLTTGQLNAEMLIAGRLMTATSGNRLEMTATGLRMFRGSNITGHWNPALGQLRIYSTSDLSHTSVGHGLQLGDDDGQNLALDNNEIMGRFNGTYGQLLLNREGGEVLIGGKVGGFNPDYSDAGVVPANDNHRIQLRGHVEIHNASDGDYSDEFAPLMVGPRGGFHLFMDSNEIGASTGDGVGTLYLNAAGDVAGFHNEPVVIGSNSIQIRRGGNYAAGDRIGFIGYHQGGVGLRFEGSTLSVKDGANAGYNPIQASAFTVSSQRAVKTDITEFDALQYVRSAPSRRWKYRNDIEADDHWHFGPMLEDLPADLRRALGRATEDETGEDLLGYDVVSLVGVLWEAVRELTERIGE